MPKIIELSGIVGLDITAKKLKTGLPKNGDKAVLKVDSIGGSVYEANRLSNTIDDHLSKFPDSITVELGAAAASSASYFYSSVGRENIKARENTIFMGHKAWALTIGNSDDMKLESEILAGFDKMIAKAYSKITGRTVDSLLGDMKNEFWLMGGEAIVDAGFASGIIKSNNSSDDDDDREDVLDKSEVLAMIEESKIKIREIENSEDLNKWAAKISDDLRNENDMRTNDKISVSADKNINKDGKKMNLTDLLAANPEAEAEYEANLKAAETKGKGENEAATKVAIEANNKSIAEKLALSGMKLSDDMKNSIETGESLGDFAIREKKADLAAIEAAGNDDLGGLKNKTQTPKSADTTKDLEAQDQKDVDAYIASQTKGAK